MEENLTKLEAGLIVELNSGGPFMTVLTTYVTNPEGTNLWARVGFFTPELAYVTLELPAPALRLAHATAPAVPATA